MAFKPGVSGNPGGRPKDAVAPLARAKAPEAFRILAKLMKSADEQIALKASIAVIERAYGKPTQPIEGEFSGTMKVMGAVKMNGKGMEFKIG